MQLPEGQARREVGSADSREGLPAKEDLPHAGFTRESLCELLLLSTAFIINRSTRVVV